MTHSDKSTPTACQISAVMAALGRRPKRMSPAAIAQRRQAGRNSGAARKRAAGPPGTKPTGTFLETDKKGTPELAQN